MPAPARIKATLMPGDTRSLSRVCTPDRKSTRLNSNHGYISYAVFCLKKKKKHNTNKQKHKTQQNTSQTKKTLPVTSSKTIRYPRQHILRQNTVIKHVQHHHRV